MCVLCAGGALFSGKTPEQCRDEEVEQVRAVVNAAKAAGTVEHFVFSGLEDVETTCGGLSVPHFDGKGRGEVIVAASGIPFTIVRLSFYSENFLGFFPPRRGEDGKLSLTMPMKVRMPVTPDCHACLCRILTPCTPACGTPRAQDLPLSVFSVGDVGKVVATVLANPSAHAGKYYGLASDNITVADIAAKLSAVKGEAISYVPVPAEVFATFGFPGAEVPVQSLSCVVCSLPVWLALFASLVASVVLHKVLCLNTRVAVLTVVVIRFNDEFVIIFSRCRVRLLC